MSTTHRPRHLDDHSTTVEASRARTWTATLAHVERSLTSGRANTLTKVLGTQPESGFEITRSDPPDRLVISGRHRFATYEIELALSGPVDGPTTVTLRSFADFPGSLGTGYRALVVGTRGHVVAVRLMLRAIRRAATS